MHAPPNITPFTVDLRPDRGRVIVVPQGELDLASVDPLEARVLELCERGFAEICIDLTQLDFFDSSGLRLLLRLDQQLAARDCMLTLVIGEGAAARVLRLTRLDGRFRRASR